MQRIERYGVIALVFLLVTILAVSLWGDGEVELMAAKEAGQPGRAASAPVADLPIARTSPLVSRGARDRALPTSDSALAEDATPRERNHSRNPNVLDPAPGPQAEPEPSRRPRSALPTPAATLAAAEPPAARAPVGLETPPVPRPEPAAPAASGSRVLAPAAARTCVVGPGETLSQIAQRELGTYRRWPEIARLNGGLAPEELRQGMVLKLPSGDPVQAARVVAAATVPVAEPSAPRAAASAKPGKRTYLVRKGDVLSVIAQRELGSAQRWKEIAELNPSVDPERLLVGASLVLPGAAPAARGAAEIQVARAEPGVRAGGWSPSAAGGKVR